ncbi:MAG: fadJ [Verrucomicrobiaceae bacterium]|nr:fadJ [Verrucomicrobiaceae bacterium]
MNALLTDSTPASATGAALKPRAVKASAFSLTVDAGNIAWLTFDMPGSSVNIFNDATFRDLNESLAVLEDNAAVKALVIRSAKENVFIAGADLKSIRALPPDKLDGLLTLGQSTFNRLAALPMLKVAMIHGACVGGGYELALACDRRVADDDGVTRIGLPETQLGLLPGWGGSTRLPRLIGLPKALDIILGGKIVKASQALKLGMVDEVVAREHLESRVKTLINNQLRQKQPFSRRAPRWMVNHGPAAAMIAWKAKREVMARTRGLYPAPLLALEVASQGLHHNIEGSLALERKALFSLIRSPETGRLIDLFFKKEEAGKKALAKGHALPVTDVTVIGAGVMGAGIAHWLAGKGIRVILTDISTEALASGMNRIRKLVEEALKRRLVSKKEARDTLDHISPVHTLVPLHRCQLIIEAATEDLELKKRIFAGLAARCHPDTVLATNTSALSVTALASVVPHPERVIGLHFFNPVSRMPLVEVISLPESSDDAVATAFALVQRLGKTPVLVKDSPGFIVNRILIPYVMEAVRLFDAGHNPEDIDHAMLDFGMPMGPMRLLDEIGLDVAAHVAKTLQTGSDTLTHMVAAGMLGKKSGKGFYLHARRTRVNPAALSLRPSSQTHADRAGLQARLAGMLSDEALRCLKDGTAASAGDIDLAMVLGTGYAPFRGGPIAHSLILGNAAVKD